MTQDQTINALAAIGLAELPFGADRPQARHPACRAGRIFWPVWLDPLRIADLDAALCCDRTSWTWPTMCGRRWVSNKLYCFARGELCEP